MGRATVEKIAVNAVMAGLPAHLSAGADRRGAGGALDPVIKLEGWTLQPIHLGPGS